MKKKIGIISLIVVILAILIGLAIKFWPSGEWDSYEVAKESLKNLENAESYSFERKVETLMLSSNNEVLNDSLLEIYNIKVGSNDVFQMDYSDNLITEGEKRELGKATFYFDQKAGYSDEKSQNYHWMAEEILEEESIQISVNTLSSFVAELNMNQSNPKMNNAEISKEEKEGQYVITITYKDEFVESSEVMNTFYIDKETKMPVKLEITDKANGYQITETYKWKDINKVGEVHIPKEMEVVTGN